MNTEPLRKYIESRDAMLAGNPEAAVKLLAESLGAEPTPYMADAIKDLADPNEAVLTLILHESKERVNE